MQVVDLGLNYRDLCKIWLAVREPRRRLLRLLARNRIPTLLTRTTQRATPSVFDGRQLVAFGLLPQLNISLGRRKQRIEIRLSHPDRLEISDKVRQQANMGQTIVVNVKGSIPHLAAI